MVAAYLVLPGWFFSFSIIFLIPIDVSSVPIVRTVNVCFLDLTKSLNRAGMMRVNIMILPDDVADCAKTANYLSDDTLLTIWRVIYWTM